MEDAVFEVLPGELAKALTHRPRSRSGVKWKVKR